MKSSLLDVCASCDEFKDEMHAILSKYSEYKYEDADFYLDTHKNVKSTVWIKSRRKEFETFNMYQFYCYRPGQLSWRINAKELCDA